MATIKSIEEKAKAYDEALKKAKRLYEEGTITESLCHIFPELKESEDENVRKAMIDLFKHEREEGITVLHYGVNIERMIAWLEKQSKQKPTEIRTTGYWHVEDIEQKSAEWSEEDEKEVAVLEAYIRSKDWSDRHIDRALGIVDELVKKLKSLKDRYTWKPSEEQMNALEHFVRSVGESGYASPYDNDTKFLYSLIAQLKKLREE